MLSSLPQTSSQGPAPARNSGPESRGLTRETPQHGGGDGDRHGPPGLDGEQSAAVLTCECPVGASGGGGLSLQGPHGNRTPRKGTARAGLGGAQSRFSAPLWGVTHCPPPAVFLPCVCCGHLHSVCPLAACCPVPTAPDAPSGLSCHSPWTLKLRQSAASPLEPRGPESPRSRDDVLEPGECAHRLTARVRPQGLCQQGAGPASPQPAVRSGRCAPHRLHVEGLPGGPATLGLSSQTCGGVLEPWVLLPRGPCSDRHPPPLAPTGHTQVRTAPLCSPSSPGNRVCHRPPPRGVESPHQGWPSSHLSGRSDHRPLRGSPRLCPHSTRTLCSRVPVAVTLTGPHTRPRTLITACLLPSRLRDWPCPPSVASSSHRGTLPWEGSRGPKAGQEPGSR